MTQLQYRMAQRRSGPSETGTFTFCFRRANKSTPVSAWMLKQEAGEAAFLTTALDAPTIGERLELSEPSAATPPILGDQGTFTPHLPRFGRVIRLDDPEGVTCKVAIRFEAPASE